MRAFLEQSIQFGNFTQNCFPQFLLLHFQKGSHGTVAQLVTHAGYTKGLPLFSSQKIYGIPIMVLSYTCSHYKIVEMLWWWGLWRFVSTTARSRWHDAVQKNPWTPVTQQRWWVTDIPLIRQNPMFQKQLLMIYKVGVRTRKIH